MLRPSLAELEEANAALKKLIDSDPSPAKALLKKFEPLMLLQPPRLNVAATYTQTTQRMGPRHLAFVEIAKQGNIDLLLHGDSITDWWVQGEASKAVFDKYFGDIRTANFAIAGDTTQGVLWGLRNGEGQGFHATADPPQPGGVGFKRIVGLRAETVVLEPHQGQRGPELPDGPAQFSPAVLRQLQQAYFVRFGEDESAVVICRDRALGCFFAQLIERPKSLPVTVQNSGPPFRPGETGAFEVGGVSGERVG